MPAEPADSHPVSSRTRSKATSLQAKENGISQTKTHTETDDTQGKNGSKKQKANVSRKKTGLQKGQSERNSKRLMLQQLKKRNPQDLKSLFGTIDIKWSDLINKMHSFIVNKEPEKLKIMLNLKILDFGCEADMRGDGLFDAETCYIKPVSLAVKYVSLDCLDILVHSENFMELDCKIFPVLAVNLIDTIIRMNSCDFSEFQNLFKCFKLLLSYGAGVGNKIVPLRYIDRHIHETTDHIQLLHAAGADFYFYSDDIDSDPSGFLSYLYRKYNPQPDDSGYYQPKAFQNVCRDFIREYIMDNYAYAINLFVLSKALVLRGHLTKTTADFLVYNLCPDANDNQEVLF